MTTASKPRWHTRVAQQCARSYSSTVTFFKSRPLLVDGLLATVLTLLAVGGHLTADPVDSERSSDALGVFLAIMAHAPLIFRRKWPVATLVVVATATWAFWVLDYATNFMGGVLVALYSVMAHEPSRARAWAYSGAVGVASVAIVFVGVASSNDNVGFGTLLEVLTLFGVAVVLGDNMRNRRAYLRELEEKAARTEADAAAEAERAVAEERTRIARELHDVVAHSMSVMVVQASAAKRVLESDPDKADEALTNIEATGRASLTEMRRILGVLRTEDDDTELAPQPTMEQFAALVEQCADAGVEVGLEIDGEPRELSAGMELAIFRIVQEALTNVVKHSGAAAATVGLRYGVGDVVVEIVDTGTRRGDRPVAPGSGHGLVGMRERVELFDGDLEVGPRPQGGFAVRAKLPTSPVLHVEEAPR